MHHAVRKAAAALSVVIASAARPHAVSADVGKLRPLPPAERAERLNRLRPNYQMPWLLPAVGPATVVEASEAFNYALWTLATPEWVPDLVMAVEISKGDYRIKPKKNPMQCRPGGGGVEVHYDHKGPVADDVLVMARIADASCDAASQQGETYVAYYFASGTIALGSARIDASDVAASAWLAVGYFGGKHHSAVKRWPNDPVLPIVNLYHTTDMTHVARTDQHGNVYFNADGGQILAWQWVRNKTYNEKVSFAPEEAFAHIPGVGLLSGMMNYENGFDDSFGYDQLQDEYGRWRMWTHFNRAATGIQIKSDTLDFWQNSAREGKYALVETADTTELGAPGRYVFEGPASLAGRPGRLSGMLDLARGKVRAPAEGEWEKVLAKVVDDQQFTANTLDRNRREKLAEIAQNNAEFDAARRAAEARSRESRMQAFAEMNRIVNNMRDQRMYDDYRRQAIAQGRQSRQADQFGFNPPPPPPPPSYEEWRASTEARRNYWRLVVRTTQPVANTPPPRPTNRSGAQAPVRTIPPPRAPLNMRGTAVPA